ncbi:MAG: hypothetical protein RL662_1914 [Bacteroidota bacterium]|jgi:phospholipase A1
MNKKSHLTLIFAILFIVSTQGQESIEIAKHDSVMSKVSHLERVETVINSVFKPDKELIADDIIKKFDDSPSFDIYKDNYIVVGSDLLDKPTRSNSDAKFQISILQRLTNSVLPFKTYLFLSYSQLAFWNVFEESFPFRDINFNPTVGLGRPLVHNNRYLGDIALQLEHESNGKDGDASRSWNKISVQGLFKINSSWTLFSKAWIPIVDGVNNPDIVQYKGYGILAANYNQHKKYNISLILNKRTSGLFNTNITLNLAYRISKNDNQYLFFEYYNGYGEGLLDYKDFRQRFRLGFVIKPNFKFIY